LESPTAGDGRFTTPLATLHIFNGWADKFLSTPENGLADSYLLVGGGTERWNGVLVYHDFDADTTGGDYGQEIDAELTYEAKWGQTFGAALGFYEAETLFDDTGKIWLWTSYAF